MHDDLRDLSRRERQMMDVIFAQGRATAAEVRQAIPNPPSYSAVRALLRILEEKGMLRHFQEGARYVYRPTESRLKASRSAIKRVLDTFFEGSLVNAVTALVDTSDGKLSAEEFQRLQKVLKAAKEKKS